METKRIIENQINILELEQVKEIINDIGIIYVFDNTKTAFCFGIIIDNLIIGLGSNKIYPILNPLKKINLNEYYVFKIFDYGAKIPYQNGYISFEEEYSKLMENYQKTIDWYYNELLENEKNNIISFDKIKALRYNK